MVELGARLRRARRWLPGNDRQALFALLVAQALVSAFWLSQGGVVLVKDSYAYLAIARQVAEQPFFADYYAPFPSTDFILTRGPFYAFIINGLQALPGGFAPYHFVLTQALHFALVLGFYYLARLWRGPAAAFVVATLCLLEPFHHGDLLSIKPSIFTQPSIVVAVAFAAWGMARRRWTGFIWAALALGSGEIFRAMNAPFALILIALAWVGLGQWRTRLGVTVAILLIVRGASLPDDLYRWTNPQYRAGATGMMFVANRFVHFGLLTPDNTPQAMARTFGLAPRLRQPGLAQRFSGTSLPLYHAFRHERVHRHGESPGRAVAQYAEIGAVALSEDPWGYAGTVWEMFWRNWDLHPSRSLDYRLPLRAPQQTVATTLCGTPMLRTQAFWGPFEEATSAPMPNLMPRGMVASLGAMPIPGELSYGLGRLWQTLWPGGGRGALAALLLASALVLRSRQWRLAGVGLGVIGVYLAIVNLAALATTQKMFMVLPWITWLAAMAVAQRWAPATSQPDP